MLTAHWTSSQIHHKSSAASVITRSQALIVCHNRAIGCHGDLRLQLFGADLRGNERSAKIFISLLAEADICSRSAASRIFYVSGNKMEDFDFLGFRISAK